MLNQSDIASVHPVARIMPVLAVENIGNVVQELGDRATQFVKGQVYFAQVLSKVSDTAYNVKVQNVEIQGGVAKDIVLKMELGSAAKAGQTLTLKYMYASPDPTFFLAQAPTNIAGTITDISSAANTIAHYLKQAEGDGVSTRFKATAIVTHSPNNPQVVAQDLKNAVSSSGLFYESHLSELVQSNQSLTAIKQEPQNQGGSSLAALMSQQLAILENQRISWQGEVWPGQEMAWDIYQEQSDKEDESWGNKLSKEEDRPIFSELTLHLPRLGKVSARITLVDGRVSINIQAEQMPTLETLKNQKHTLAEAIVKNGQQLDALTLMPQSLMPQSKVQQRGAA